MGNNHSKQPSRPAKVPPVTKDAMRGTNDAVTAIGVEWEDRLFRQHNVYEKLLEQAKSAKLSPNWRVELDEL